MENPKNPQSVKEAVEACVRQLGKLNLLSELPEAKNENPCPPSRSKYLTQQYIGAASQPREVRLRRLLAYGDEVPIYLPGNREMRLINQENSAVILECVKEADEQVVENDTRKPPSGRKKKDKEQWDSEWDEWDRKIKEEYPLLQILEEYLDPENGWELRFCAIYVLAVCVRTPCKKNLKNGFYRLAEKYVESEEDLFFFIKVATAFFGEETDKKGKKRVRRGYGRGMRRLVKRWYQRQEPEELLKRVLHVKSHYGWKHSDLIRMAHVTGEIDKEDNAAGQLTPLTVVITFLINGYNKAMALCQDKSEFGPILRVLEQHNHNGYKRESAPEVIRKLQLKVEQVRTECRQDSMTWLAMLAHMSPSEVVHRIRSLWKVESAGNSNLLLMVAANRLRAADDGIQVNPCAVAIARTNFLMASYSKKKQHATHLELGKIDSMIVKALDELLTKSIEKIGPKIKRRVVAAIHFGEAGKERCAHTHSMSAEYAAALILLSLSHQFTDFELLLFGSRNRMIPVEFPETGSINRVLELFREKNDDDRKKINPKMGAPMLWANTLFDVNRQVDAFVVITPSLKYWSGDIKGSAPLTALNAYHRTQAETGMQEQKRAKFVLCALTPMVINCAQPPRSLHAMDFTGFDVNTVFVLKKYICGAFDDMNVLPKAEC
ncbi:RNA-binding protein RO60-like [Cloeon dipterum]|uniref:RNA-binding protein RO60-like n=1 Tax=Cloeon dipterum TaxID=197152 RepID=UPI0032205515